MKRDKAETSKKLIGAAQRLLGQPDFKECGVNAIAREAKVDKVLIYRYFGGLPELLRAMAEDTPHWPSAEELHGPGVNPRRVTDIEGFLIKLLINTLKELRRRKSTQGILQWELTERNKLIERVAETREKQWSELLAGLSIDASKYPDLDLTALMALLHAGLSYLVLLSRTTDRYLGIDLHSNYGWQRLEKAIDCLIRACLAQRQS